MNIQTSNQSFELLAPFYDAIYPPEQTIKQTVEFIEKLTKKDREKGREVKILEVFTRTGKYSIELAKRGFQVKGIDICKKMIKIAQRKAEKEGLEKISLENITLEEEKGKYDLILLLNNIVSFINSSRELKMLLINSKHLLEDNGKIILHVVNYRVRRKKSSRYYPLKEIIIENKNYLVQRFLDLEPKLFFNINIMGKKGEKWGYFHKFSFPLTYYSLKNLQNHISSSGLKIEKIYGNYEEEKFNENNSKNLILVVSKRKQN